METITIPKRLLKEKDVILVPRKEYEKLLKRSKFYEDLDRDLDKAIKSYRAGRFYGPFESVEESRRFLENRRKKKK